MIIKALSKLYGSKKVVNEVSFEIPKERLSLW